MAVGAQAYTWGKNQESETVTGVLVSRDKGQPKAMTSELEGKRMLCSGAPGYLGGSEDVESWLFLSRSWENYIQEG